MKSLNWKLYLVSALFLVSSCSDNSSSAITGQPKIKSFAAESILISDTLTLNNPVLAVRNEKIRNALVQNVPILFLDKLDPDKSLAQIIASSDERFRANLIDRESKQPFFSEIFNIYQARPQDMGQVQDPTKVFRVEMYNYALNLTTVAIVDLVQQQVLNVNNYPQTQPDLNKDLENLAINLAIHSPEVIKALGYKPGEQQALMAATKTSLNRTYCERSMHLCVAPTFIKDDKALWAIVDLTDYRVVGIRWTNVGTTGPVERISERNLLFDKVMECHCKVLTALNKDDWKMNYILTSSDGLRISEVYFKNKLILQNAKLVDWHVSYSGTDGFGYSDAVGCPEFSHAAVLAVSSPTVSELMEDGKKVGFVLEQSYQSEQWPLPCNYNYVQRYEFYSDGRFRTAVASLGRGCGSDGTYRPVTRIAFASDKSFSEWDKEKWMSWDKEQWRLQNSQTSYTPEGYQYKISDRNNMGFYLEPGKGQFKDGGRGDNAYVYVTKLHAEKDEGEKDMVTIGPCCNVDYQQGPEKFIDPLPENIQNGPLVIWYVAQLKNDDRKGNEYCWAERYLDKGVYKTRAFPCMSGPMFVPIQ